MPSPLLRRTWWTLAIGILGFAPLTPTASAQCQPVWQPTPIGTAATDVSGGVIYASQTWTPSGQNTRVVIGGSFTTCSGVSGYNHIAMWDGTAWLSMGIGGINGFVYSLAVFNGELVAAGQFTSAGGVACNNIAAFNGTSWHSLGSGTGNPVFAMVNANGTLYVGGNFTVAGGVACNNIASWNGSSWASLGSGSGNGVNNPVYSMCFENPGIIVGGNFTTAGGGSASHIARWTGSSWQALGAGVSADVLCVAKYNNQIYAGGDFAECNGTATNAFCIARWNGSTWNPMGPGGNIVGLISTHAPPRADSMFVYNNTLFIGGLFDLAGGSPAAGIVSWDGSVFSQVGAGIGPPTGEIFAMSNFQNCLMTFGAFNTAGGVPVGQAARWNGTEWSSLKCQPSGTVLAMAIVNGGLSVGGAFDFQTSLGTTAHNLVGYSTADTVGPFQNLGGFTGTNGPVYAICNRSTSPVLPDSRVIAGSFSAAGGVGVSNIALVSAVSEYSAMGAGLNGTVTCVRQFGSIVYAGGSFSVSGATAVNRIAKFSGGAWVPAGTTGVSGGTPTCLAVYNGNLYMGGDFTSVDGLDTGGISRFNGTNWNIMVGHFAGTVEALTVYNGLLIIGGIFPGTQNSPNIATWNGTSYTGMGTGLANGYVTALAVHNNELYAGGSFFIPGSPTLVDIAKWNGSSWVAVDASLAPQSVTSLQSFNGALWAGGGFTGASGHFQPYITRLACTCYSNCDNSSIPPILNANDFQCFLNAFASGDMYANCDGSVVTPILNANDFQCFLNAFAAGCN